MSSSSTQSVQLAKVSQPAFMGILWTFTGLSLTFILFRVYTRIRAFRKLFADDFLAITAWVFLFATAILWQIEAPVLYRWYLILAGEAAMDPEIIDKYGTFMKFIVPLTILFYCCIWCVKFSFLVFFYKLGSKIRSHQIWWWIVTAVTIAALIASIADIDYQCSLGGLEYIIATCPTLEKIHFQNRTFYANCAADVITDILILSIPFLILWRVHIPLRRKLILFSVFSVTIVVMAVSIIRVVVNNNPNQNADITWLYFWSFVEMGTAIMIACVASFRQLFVTTQNQHLYGQTSNITPRRGLLYFLRSASKTKFSSKSDSRVQNNWGARRSSDGVSERSEANILPLDSVHVRNTFEVTSMNAKKEQKVPSESHNIV